MNDRPYIFNLDPPRMRALVETLAMPPYRAEQVLRWVYQRRIADPRHMTDLPLPDREQLARAIRFTDCRIVSLQHATDSVRKLLLQWSPSTGPSQLLPISDPSRQTECVMIPSQDHPAGATCHHQPHPADVQPKMQGNLRGQTRRHPLVSGRSRTTACISSQIGCPVGCRFCASGLGGLDGNLTAGQIVEQVWQLGRLDEVNRISHVVFMGMGEPLANFKAVIAAVRTITADWGLGISARRVTISTVGLPNQIRRLARTRLPVTLALSLHAPNDELRQQLIPWAKRVTIAQLIDAGSYYFKQTGREVTLEYTLIHGVNDQPQHARELAVIASRLRSNVNLIRYNEVEALAFRRPNSQAVHQFQRLLRAKAVNTHIRASRGRDIAAACGQLRHEHREASEAAQAR